MRRTGLLALIFLEAILSAPAHASTIPDLPGLSGAGTYQASVFNFAYDHRFGPNLALGASTILNPFDFSLAIRGTWPLTEAPGFGAGGLSIGLGISETTALGFRGPVGASPPTSRSIWFQPGFVTRSDLGQWLRLRTYLAPSIRWGGSSNGEMLALWRQAVGNEWLSLGAVAGVELAVPVAERHEITIGSGSIIGWRAKL